MEKAVTRLDFHPSVLLLFFFVIQHLVDKTQDKLLISSAALCNKPFNPVYYFFIRNCTRSQYLVKKTLQWQEPAGSEHSNLVSDGHFLLQRENEG